MRAGGQHLLIIRDGDQLWACERTCPHEQADLALGRYADGKLLCPRHLAWFNLSSGEVSAGWTVRLLRVLPVRIRGDTVEIDVSEAPCSSPDASA